MTIGLDDFIDTQNKNVDFYRGAGILWYSWLLPDAY